jgi:hypothetical protein
MTITRDWTMIARTGMILKSPKPKGWRWNGFSKSLKMKEGGENKIP